MRAGKDNLVLSGSFAILQQVGRRLRRCCPLAHHYISAGRASTKRVRQPVPL